MDCSHLCDFQANYECSALPAVKALECEVLGCDYGGTSWTTREQAEHIVSSLALDPRSSLLEVGCGSGWPGLFLSTTTGCGITMLDMPLIALEQAAERAATDKILHQVHLVNGSGTALPFDDASFSSLSHSDVLCCLPEKLEMLQECRRVAKRDGRMHFSAIKPAPGLSPADHRQAVETGPPFVEVPDGYDSLLRKSAWNLLDRIDVTVEYANSLQTLVAGLKTNTPALREAFGPEGLRETWQHREDQLNLARENILQRIVYVVRANS